MGRGFGERRAGGPGTAPARRPRGGSADHLVGGRAGETPASRAALDVLRARAYLDLLLGQDSRPRQDADGSAASPAGGVAPGGFAGRVTLTVPLTNLTRLADRPGEIPGIGPVDPWLARDLANAAAANPKTTWCITVTDEQGHAVGHGCARPESTSHRKRAGPGPPSGARDGPGSLLTGTGEDKPPGGYGSWRLLTQEGAGSAGHPRSDCHTGVRSPVPGQGPRSRSSCGT